MTPLFSDAGRRRLDEIAHPGLLCAFDFDGTLAPIVTQPEEARLSAEVRRRLLTLSSYAPIAIITGRALDDIRRRLGFEPDFVVGNHGAEGVPGWEAQAARHRDLCGDWHAQLRNALRGNGWDPGIQVEDKSYSLSVHYRMSADPERSAAALRSLFEGFTPPPRIVDGKYVFNLVPQDAADKGRALERLIAHGGTRGAIYVGDDVTDEDVFRLRRPDLLSVRVEPATHSAAEFFLQRQEDILPLLEDLTTRLRTRRADISRQA